MLHVTTAGVETMMTATVAHMDGVMSRIWAARVCAPIAVATPLPLGRVSRETRLFSRPNLGSTSPEREHAHSGDAWG